MNSFEEDVRLGCEMGSFLRTCRATRSDPSGLLKNGGAKHEETHKSNPLSASATNCRSHSVSPAIVAGRRGLEENPIG